MDEGRHNHWNCMSWSAIIIGSLIAVGLSFLMNLFGVSIGLSAFTRDQEGLMVIALGGFLGLLLGSIVIMFVAGWVSGYLSRTYCHGRELGALYGFISWCLALIITLFLSFQAGHVLNINLNSLSGSYMTRNQGDMVSSMASRKDQKKVEGPTRTDTTTEKAANMLGVPVFLTFILFFIGALSACFGGYFGHGSKEECLSKKAQF